MIITLKYHVFENIIETGAFALFSFGANAPVSIIFLKYSKLNLIFSSNFFNVL